MFLKPLKTINKPNLTFFHQELFKASLKGKGEHSEQSSTMFASSSPFFGVLMCCGTDPLPIVFQRFLYRQTFTFKAPFAAESCVLGQYCLRWEAHKGWGSQQLILAQGSPGVWMDVTFWVKIKQWPLVKPKSGFGGTNSKGQK